MNSRLDTLQAAVLLEKIKIFDRELMERNNVAERYRLGLQDILDVPILAKDYESSWAQYTVLAKDEDERTRIMRALKEKDIPSMIYYATPIHKQAVYAGFKGNYSDLSVSEKLSKRVFSLPIHGYMEEEEIALVIETIRKELMKS